MRTPVFPAALLVAVCVAPGIASAHEMRPALLELRPVEGGSLATLSWTYPDPDQRPVLVVPTRCPVEVLARGPERLTLRIACPLDEVVAESRLQLDAFTPDAVVRVHGPDGTRTTAVGRDSADLGIEPSSDATSPGFVWLGVEHIWGGLDHLLFVLGLLLIVFPGERSLRRLVPAITAFTIAHSITLGLSVLDLVRLPVAGVEAAIAASLVLLAVEATHRRETWTRRQPATVAFAFGLLHGFGFASGLREIGLPEDGLAAALFSFNVGVELGQLAFLGACLAALHLSRRLVPQRVCVAAGVYAVGGLGTFWFLQRSAAVVSGVMS